MSACTSPAFTDSVMPLRISTSLALARRSLMSSISAPVPVSPIPNPSPLPPLLLPDTPLQTHPQQLLRLHRELHRQLLEYFLAEPVHDERDRVLRVEPALLAVEDLV